MGYNLGIGEFEVEIDHEERSARCTVPGIDGAPLGAPEDSTGAGTHGNLVYPSYTTWAEATKALGLYELFLGPEGDRHGTWTASSGETYDPLLSSHPGVAALTEDHALAFEAAAERWRAAEGRATVYDGSFMRETRWTPRPATPEEYHWNLRRAEWLVWWTRWALANCKYPTFANS